MAINQRLDIRQGQSLTMTPQLQQAIKLLQLSNLELAEFIDAELEKNPLLERDDSSTSDRTEEQSEAGDAPLSDAQQNDSVSGETPEAGTDYQERELDSGDSLAHKTDGEEGGFDYSRSTLSGVGAGGDGKFEDSDYNFEDSLVKETSLRDYLIDQIQLEFTNNKDRAIAILMVDSVDESGYFRADIALFAERLGCDIGRIEAVLRKLQGLDPAGVFARNLRECLAIQLRELNRLDPAMEALLDHLDVLAAHDLKKLKLLCAVDDEDLKQMIAEIKALNPKPAIEFDHFVSQTVIPDVLMRPLPKSKGGGWAVELNSDTLPRVLVNKTYYAEVSKTAKAKPDKEYLTQQLSTANWLVKALDQRAQTIMKVATQIIEQQEAFFNYGVEYLKPLVLKDISDVIAMHESTVSRVTTNKYIGTPRGVFELKYFFTSGVSNADGSAEYSSSAVKARIKTLIDAETIDNILSDDDLVAFLKKDGIEIARRTVAKYREAFKIPSSVQRRRLKNQQK
jgi:RNA polymerase sigma-54 factor